MKKTVFLLGLLLLFNSCDSDQMLYRIVESNKVGYIDSEGNIVIPPQYDNAGEFHNGLALVVENVRFDSSSSESGSPFNTNVSIRYGYINKRNKFVIPPILVYQVDFSEISQESLFSFLEDKLRFSQSGLAIYQDNQKRLGYINKKGAVAIDPQFADAKIFSEGKAPVKKLSRQGSSNINNEDSSGLWGCIDEKGNVVLDYKYISMDNYRRDRTFAVLSSAFNQSLDSDGTMLPDENGGVVIKHEKKTEQGEGTTYTWRTYLLDERGFIKSGPLSQMYEYHNYSNDDIACAIPNRIGSMLGLSPFFLDHSGNEIRPGRDEDESNLNYLLGRAHNLQLLPSDFHFISCTRFDEGYAAIQLENGAWTYINDYLIICGKDANNYLYEDAYPFSEGLAAVKLDGKYGFIDHDFNLVIPCKYDEVNSFEGGLALVYLNQPGVEISLYIDKKGKVVWQGINSGSNL